MGKRNIFGDIQQEVSRANTIFPFHLFLYLFSLKNTCIAAPAPIKHDNNIHSEKDSCER